MICFFQKEEEIFKLKESRIMKRFKVIRILRIIKILNCSKE